MPKTKYEHINFLPKAYNYSDIGIGDTNDNSFDPTDNGVEEECVYSELATEKKVLSILSILNDREKIVFLCQLVRDDGYRIDHLAISQAMHISRSLYMMLLKKIKTKAKYVLLNKTNE